MQVHMPTTDELHVHKKNKKKKELHICLIIFSKQK